MIDIYEIKDLNYTPATLKIIGEHLQTALQKKDVKSTIKTDPTYLTLAIKKVKFMFRIYTEKSQGVEIITGCMAIFSSIENSSEINRGFKETRLANKTLITQVLKIPMHIYINRIMELYDRFYNLPIC